MEHTCTHLVEGVSSVHRLKVDGFSVTKSTIRNKKDCLIKSRCIVDGLDWEIQFHTVANKHSLDAYWIQLVLVYLGGQGTDNTAVTVDLSGELVDQTGDCHLVPLTVTGKSTRATLRCPLDRSPAIYLCRGKVKDDVQEPAGHLIKSGSSFTVECKINVHSYRDPIPISPPSSNLQQQLGELLQNQSGVDVTFVVSGESISAHKSILAARSPIFMAQFFGSMLERSSPCVEIQDMHPAVFKAMLQYIYTDEMPELDNNNKQPAETDEETTVMAQHLLVAADRYGLDRLKAMCEERLSLGISIGTVASTLALADQHNFSLLKAKCINFISGGSSKTLQAILETEGYRHLEASNPSVLTELLKAAHGKKRKQSIVVLS